MNNKADGGKNETNNVYTDKNYVAKDQIWRDYIQKTAMSAKKWPETWGFLKGEHEDVKIFFFSHILTPF